MRKQITYSENKIYPYAELSDLREDVIARARKMGSFQREDQPWNTMTDIDLLMLRSFVTNEFNETFEQGLKFYLQGHWSQAKPYFEQCNESMSKVPGMDGDGPSKTLLRYMAAENFVAPSSWAGYRPLTSK